MDVREAQGSGAPKPLRFGLHAALFCDEGNFLFYKNAQNNFNLHILSRIDSGIHKIGRTHQVFPLQLSSLISPTPPVPA